MRSYPLKHYLLTISIAPILLTFMELIISSKQNAIGLFQFYPFFLVMGIIFSLPSFLIYLLVFNTIIHRNISVFIKKVIMIIAAIMGICITFLVIGGSMAIAMSISYSITALIFGSVFSITEMENFLPNHE